jgi:putative effector of murein hydrolase LrgA (UPF0299 family)
MTPFFDSFQKELGKRTAQILLLVVAALLSVAAFHVDLDKHTARIILLCLAALCLLLFVCGLYFSYREEHKQEELKKPLGIYRSRSFDNDKPDA